MDEEKLCVVLFSGGLDSTTLLYYVNKVLKREEVYGLSFNYGQRHLKELEYAKYHGDLLCVEHKIVDMSSVFNVFNKTSSLLNKDVEMPQEHYTHENQKVTVVPNRNMIMLSIAVGYAESLNIDEVYYSPHANDMTTYPDCRPDFVESINKTSQLATYNKVKIFAPSVNKYKSDLVRLGTELKIDYSKTWSCYEGGEKPCLKCATDLERTEAFLKNNIKDPLLSNKDWEIAKRNLQKFQIK